MTKQETIKRDYEFRKTKRVNFDQDWQLLKGYLNPNSTDITIKRAPGQRQTEELFDSTAIDASEKLIGELASTLTSAAFRWFTLRMREETLNQIPEVRLWLDDASTRMFQALQQSNFRTASIEVYQSIVNYGTGMLYEEERERLTQEFSGLRFEAAPIGSYVFDEDGLGRANQVTRLLRMQLMECAFRWGTDRMHPDRREQLKRTPYEFIDVLHDIRPNEAETRWESIYMDFEKETIFSAGMFFDFPCMIPRWSKQAGEVFGRGRGHTALPEIRTLNRARQLKLRQWGLAVSPPLQTLDDGIVGKPRLMPGALNVVRSLDAIRPIDIGQRFDHTAIPEAESKLQIRQIFYTEQLLQFAALAKTPPTATEVIQRIEFLHHLLGPAVGRLQDELLDPLIDRTFNIMLRAKAFAPMPLILEALGGDIDVEYEGPLARAQKSDELKSLNDLMIVAGGLAQFDPEVLDHYDLDMVAKDLPRITGSSLRYLRADDQVERRRAVRQQAVAQQQQAQLAAQGASTARDVGQAAQSFAQAGTQA